MTSQEKAQDLRGLFYIIVTLLSWASVLLFLRHLHPYIDAWTANGWRYGMCACFLFPMLLLRRKRHALPEGLWRRALVPALFNSIGQTCFGFSIYYIEPGLAGFLLRVALISSTLGAFILFADERALLRRMFFWAGMSLVISGSVGTILLSVHPIAGATATGVILGAASGAFFGLYGVSVRYWMRGIPSVQSFSVISTYTAMAMIGLMLWQGQHYGLDIIELSSMNLVILFGSAFLGIAIGHIFYYASIARLGVAITGAVVQLAPFLGGVASVVVFGEILTAGQWISGIIMLVGSVLLLKAEQQRPRVSETIQPAFPVELEDVGDPGALSAESACVSEAPSGQVRPSAPITDLDGCS